MAISSSGWSSPRSRASRCSCSISSPMARASSSESQAAGDLHLFARHVLGAQRLAEPAFVVRDQVRGGGEDVAGLAVIAFQPDDLGAGKVMLEAQDVVDLRAAPAIDRLVVVADAADVFAVLRRAGRHARVALSPGESGVGSAAGRQVRRLERSSLAPSPGARCAIASTLSRTGER